ncbi:MAG: glutamate 5-kinase [Nitrospinae bacterium]|nr:glutamate 5-kinase [Nitrospinota bacterium]
MDREQRLSVLRGVRRVVVKIGSGVLKSGGETELCHDTMRRLVEDIAMLRAERKCEVVLVTSGAVMAGRKYLGLPNGKLTIPQKQAAAAAGMSKLMAHYDRFFGERGIKVGQILLNYDDIEDRHYNIENTLNTLLGLGAVPIINENDSTAVDEIKFGDNDSLAAKISPIAKPDLLLILSDVEGMYDADPRKNPGAKLIPDIFKIGKKVLAQAGEGGAGSGTGGMRAKVVAAKIATDYGVATLIISGKKAGAIREAFFDGTGGTFFHPSSEKLTAKKHRIMHISRPKGIVVIDAGAKRAILKDGKSLLPSGIVEVDGGFESGQVVAIRDQEGMDVARGEANYSAGELRRIMGRKSAEIERILGYKSFDEVVHRDNMGLIAAGTPNGN